MPASSPPCKSPSNGPTSLQTRTGLAPNPAAPSVFKGDPSTAPAQPPCQLGTWGQEVKTTAPCETPEDLGCSTKASGASLCDLKQGLPSTVSLSSTSCKMGRLASQILPNPKALSLEMTASDKLHGALGSCFRKLHKHPSEKQKSKLKTAFFFNKDIKKPFL